MAKAKKVFPYTNSMGEYSVYSMKGCDHLVVRSKGGPTPEMFNTSPKFATVRKNSAEFTGAGMAAGKIQRAMYALKHLADYNIGSALVSISKTIQKLDDLNPVGKRSILFSQYPHILEGFNLNKNVPFNSVIKNQIDCIISRENLSATITLPDLLPKINFAMQWNCPLYRMIMVFGIIPDIKKGRQGYNAANRLTKYFPVQVQTDWVAATAKRNREEFVLRLSPDSNFDDTNSLIVSIGIEVGSYVTNSIIQPVKDAGCAKILAHV